MSNSLNLLHDYLPMTGKKAEIYEILSSVKKHPHDDDKPKRKISIYFFLFLAIFLAIAIVSLYMYIGLQKDYRSLLLDSLRRAEQLEEEKKFVASREIYLSIQKIP